MPELAFSQSTPFVEHRIPPGPIPVAPNRNDDVTACRDAVKIPIAPRESIGRSCPAQSTPFVEINAKHPRRQPDELRVHVPG